MRPRSRSWPSSGKGSSNKSAVLTGSLWRYLAVMNPSLFVEMQPGAKWRATARADMLTTYPSGPL